MIVGSNDLSAVIDKTLIIKIEGEGNKHTEDYWTRLSVAQRVEIAWQKITIARLTPHVKDPKKSRWELVSFDDITGDLVVRRA